MKPEILIAVKEFKSSLTSSRFLILFTALLVMSIAAIVTGVGDYYSQLAAYSYNLTPAASVIYGQFKPQVPSMMFVFQRFSVIFAIVGWILAVAIGFDLISKEKETGSLKLLLARPVFRDSVINGKILGSTAVLAVALAAAFLLAIAVLMLQGIVPTGDDLVNIAIFFIIVVMFSLAFLAMAITASVIAKNSTMAMLMLIGFVVFSFSVPAYSGSISNIILGPAPPATIPYSESAVLQLNAESGGPHAVHVPGSPDVSDVAIINGVKMMDNPAYIEYERNELAITGTLGLVSPIYDFNGISSAVVQPKTVDIGPNGYVVGINGNRLLTTVPEMISLLLITISGFAVSYVRFLRMDVR